MVLKGGWNWPKFWRNVGYVAAFVVIGAVIGAVGGLAVCGVAALYGVSLSLGSCLLFGSIVGAAFGFTIATIEIQKEEEKKNIVGAINVCRDVESKAISSAANILDVLKYENVLNELTNLDGLEDSVNSGLEKLRDVRDNRQFKSDNEDIISSSVSRSKGVLSDLAKKRKEIKTKAEDQALAQLEKYKSELKDSIEGGKITVAKMIDDITKPKNNRNQNLAEMDGMIVSMDCKISALEKLGREPAIFYEKLDIGKRGNLDQVNAAIGLAKREKHLLEVKKEFLQFGYDSGKNTLILDEVMGNKMQACFLAIDRDNLSVLKYLVECEKLDINSMVNEKGKSLLQNAIRKNKSEIVEYLKSIGAK